MINSRYEEYASEGYASLIAKQPVIYHSASGRPGLGQYLCSQVGIELNAPAWKHASDVSFLKTNPLQ